MFNLVSNEGVKLEKIFKTNTMYKNSELSKHWKVNPVWNKFSRQKQLLIFSLKFYEDINCKFSRNPNDFDFSNPCYGFWKQNMKIKNSFYELPTMWHESMSCKSQHHIQCIHLSDKTAHLHKDYSPNKPKHGKNVTPWDNKIWLLHTVWVPAKRKKNSQAQQWNLCFFETPNFFQSKVVSLGFASVRFSIPINFCNSRFFNQIQFP